MKIKPYFKTTLAKPYQGEHFHPAGTSVIMNTTVSSKTLGDFMIMLPDPVSLNLNSAQNSIDLCTQLKKEIDSSKEIKIFSSKISEDILKSKIPSEIKLLDPDVKIYRILDEDKVFEYLQNSMNIIVLLIVSIESFVNLTIPADYKHEHKDKKGKKVVLNKLEIVKKLSIEDKIEILVKIKSKPNIKQEKFWKTFKEIKSLRNEIIHYKKKDSKVDEMWSPMIETLFDSNLQTFLQESVNLINYINPDYLDIEE